MHMLIAHSLYMLHPSAKLILSILLLELYNLFSSNSLQFRPDCLSNWCWYLCGVWTTGLMLLSTCVVIHSLIHIIVLFEDVIILQLCRYFIQYCSPVSRSVNLCLHRMYLSLSTTSTSSRSWLDFQLSNDVALLAITVKCMLYLWPFRSISTHAAPHGLTRPLLCISKTIGIGIMGAMEALCPIHFVLWRQHQKRLL